MLKKFSTLKLQFLPVWTEILPSILLTVIEVPRVYQAEIPPAQVSDQQQIPQELAIAMMP